MARTLGTSFSRQSAAIEHGPAPAKHAAKEPKPTLKPPVRLASLERAAPLAEVILSRIPSNAGALTSRGREKPARIVARERSRLRTLVAERGRASAKHAAKEPKPSLKPPVRLASLEGTAPPAQAIPSRSPSNAGALTSLVDFETAPFPYHGTMPESGRPFLNAGTEGHRGHVNFRGHVLWESQTFSDDRVLLHIPPGFDPKRPAVMVVFFHGHGANLAQDVRDRQPDWITYNRSTFFVSSYTPHTARHNAYLERLLRERSVRYSSELRNSHLRGMVTFLPAGDISHRDFVTHAWADNPIKDILVRMDDAGQRIETARTTGSSSAVAVASKHN